MGLGPDKWVMGKDQELLEAARNGNVAVVDKILGQRAKRSGPLARWVCSSQISLISFVLALVNTYLSRILKRQLLIVNIIFEHS